MSPVFKISTTNSTERKHCLHQNRLLVQSVLSLQLFEVDSHLEEVLQTAFWLPSSHYIVKSLSLPQNDTCLWSITFLVNFSSCLVSGKYYVFVKHASTACNVPCYDIVLLFDVGVTVQLTTAYVVCSPHVTWWSHMASLTSLFWCPKFFRTNCACLVKSMREFCVLFWLNSVRVIWY